MHAPASQTTAILFLDLQEEIAKNARTVSADQLRRNAGVLAKLAKLHGIPAFLSAVPPGGTFFANVTTTLPDAKPAMRTQTTAFSDAAFVENIRLSGRRVLLLAGIASEIVVQRTALDALASGYKVQIAVDACGGIDPRTEDAAFRRVEAAGGVTTSVITFAAELAGDFTTEKGGTTLGLAYEAIGR